MSRTRCARALGADLVAEGIERDVEATFLRNEGIETAQGYLYFKPGPLDDICAWLVRRGKLGSKAA